MTGQPDQACEMHLVQSAAIRVPLSRLGWALTNRLRRVLLTGRLLEIQGFFAICRYSLREDSAVIGPSSCWLWLWCVSMLHHVTRRMLHSRRGERAPRQTSPSAAISRQRSGTLLDRVDLVGPTETDITLEWSKL